MAHGSHTRYTRCTNRLLEITRIRYVCCACVPVRVHACIYIEQFEILAEKFNRTDGLYSLRQYIYTSRVQIKFLRATRIHALFIFRHSSDIGNTKKHEKYYKNLLIFRDTYYI